MISDLGEEGCGVPLQLTALLVEVFLHWQSFSPYHQSNSHKVFNTFEYAIPTSDQSSVS